MGKIRAWIYNFIWNLNDPRRAGLCLVLAGLVYLLGWRSGWGWELSFLAGWIVALTIYLVLLYIVIFTADAQRTRERISQVDPTQWFLLIVLTIVTLLGNMSVGVILTAVGHRTALHARLFVGLSVLAVIVSCFPCTPPTVSIMRTRIATASLFPMDCAGALRFRRRPSPLMKIFSMFPLP